MSSCGARRFEDEEAEAGRERWRTESEVRIRAYCM